jgi:conjugal transfer pilus assembly protein TraB
VNKLTGKLKQAWDGLSPREKKVAVIAAIIFSLLCMMVLSYNMGGSKTVPSAKPAEQKHDAPPEPDLLEKSLYHEKEKELRQRDEQLKALKTEIDEMKKDKEQEKEKTHRSYPPVPLPAPVQAGADARVSSYPPVPQLPQQQTQKQAEPELIGDIEIISNQQAYQAKPAAPADTKKKEGEKIYLPPSFMPAVLLTGVRAKTSGDGKGEPQPLLLRVTDLAVLPNRVKKNLKDCFVVANAVGDLSQERADTRLVSLTCYARNGRVVIDQKKLKGTVLDADGVLNLDGKVVARWGSSLAASMYAGFFAGLGDGLKGASTQTLTTASGTLQTVKPGEMLLGAAGSGTASAFHKIADFMLDIARQATPVVEVGNMKPVTVFITEGVDLEVMNHCAKLLELGGAECKDDI